MDLEEAKNLSPEELYDIVRKQAGLLRAHGAELEKKDQQLTVANALLQESQAELQDSKTKLQDSKTKLQDSQAKLHSTKADLSAAKHQLNWFKRQLFGSRSERRLLEALDPSDQLWLGEQFLRTPEAPPKPGTTVRSYERKHREKPTDLVASDSKLRFDERVPVETVFIPNPKLEGLSPEGFTVIEERISYRLAQRCPYVVLKIVRQVAKVNSEAGLSCPPAPPSVFPGSIADVSFLAGLVVDKFRSHLPLYRQHQRLESNGVFIDRGTLTRLVHRVGELLEPIYHALLSSILLSSILAVDETPTPAGRGEGKMKKGYYWVFFGDLNEIVFVYSPSRGQEVLDEVLAGFEGKLLCDGYRAYESFVAANPQSTLCQCWSHARRGFIDAEEIEPAKVKKVLLKFQRVYKIEKEARDKSPEERLALRQKYSAPIVDELLEYLENDLAETALLPSNPFVKAAEYMTNRGDELRVFLSDPELQIDTNHVERALRPQAVGRKNWMFHVTEVGARHGAIFYSLIQSCLLAEVDPTAYLTDVLQRIDFHPADEVHLLTPKHWREHFQKAPLRSLLDRDSVPNSS